jgi:hypothetical protein
VRDGEDQGETCRKKRKPDQNDHLRGALERQG